MMELIKDIQKQSKKQLRESIKSLDAIFPETISLYHRAYIKKQEIQLPEIIKETTFNEISMVISFGLTGELKGFVVCECPLVSYSRTKANYQFLQGLFVESMNILLGKILTHLEEQENILCYITAPKTLTHDSNNSILLQQIESYKKNSLLVDAIYNICVDNKEIPCRLCFEIQSSDIAAEV